jgi:CheY-like chemotaxis protein
LLIRARDGFGRVQKEVEMTAKLRVLVVDDERIIADSLANILKHTGFESESAYCGEKAVAVAKTFKPDVLISDVLMHPMNGVETARRIAEDLPVCRVILMSGSVESAGLLYNSQVGEQEFEVLEKSVHVRELLKSLGSPQPGLIELRSITHR